MKFLIPFYVVLLYLFVYITPSTLHADPVSTDNNTYQCTVVGLSDHDLLHIAQTVLDQLHYSTPAEPSSAVIVDSMYNPCASLSAIEISATNAGVSGPYWVLLFNKGRYVKTANPESNSYVQLDHDIKSKNQVALIYTWVVGDESEAERKGRAIVHYIWKNGEIIQCDPTPNFHHN